MIFRYRHLCLLFVLISHATAADGTLDIKPLAPDVWLHTSWQTTATWGLVPSNGLIVREADQVVVIDTAWGAAPSRQLLAWIDRELQLPVTRLIVTHFHDDRLGGWEVFTERGTRIVASAQTLVLAKVEPTPAFDLYRLSPGEKLASGTLEILYPGPAHAPDNIVVWLPAHRIIAGGCAVRAMASGGLGNLSHASVVDWAASIARVQAAYPEAHIVIPGHGDAGGPELLTHTHALAVTALNRQTE
jgi:glyoxylase-like metal-dependent hydrolase (beta-lactamase superfamily II)